MSEISELIPSSSPDLLSELATRSPQEQVDGLIGFYNNPSADTAERMVIGNSELCLQARLAGLSILLKPSSWNTPHPNGLALKLQGFKRFLAVDSRKGWNGEQGVSTFYGDEWAALYKPRGIMNKALFRQEVFAGTSLDGLSLAELVLREAPNQTHLHYSYWHENDSIATYCDEPADAVTFLRHARKYTPRGGERYADLIGPVHELADEMFNTAFDRAKATKNYAALAELCVGADFMPTALAYIGGAEDKQNATEEVVRYTEQCVEAAEKLGQCFHPELNARVQEAFLRVGLKFVFGLEQHQTNRQFTEDSLRLASDFQLPVHLSGGEPQELLGELFSAVDDIHAAVTGSDSLVAHKAKGDGFNILRYVTFDAKGNGYSNVLEYLRPRGAYAYDPLYEYGRPKEGVEASHSFVHSKRRFIHHSKDSQDSSTLSIRIDFEGLDPRQGRDPLTARRDPTNETGTLSLDVGSILGSSHNLGVRIGRFLAWCDQLRTEEAYRYESPSFNHGYEAFQTGSQAEFSRLIEEVHDSRVHSSRYAPLVRLRALAVRGLNEQE